MSPPTVVNPVLVIVLPASIAYDDAVPRSTVAVAAMADGMATAAKVRKAIPVTSNVAKDNLKDRRAFGRRGFCFGSRPEFEEECFVGGAEVDMMSFPKIAMLHH